MFQIVVFDERRSSERTRKILEQYAQKNQMSFQIETIFEEQKLLKFLEEHQDLDVVFLDIRIGEDVDGIDVARKINILAPRVAIVFLTGYTDYATEVYDARQLYFAKREELGQSLVGIFFCLHSETARRNRGFVHIHAKGKELIIREEEILYIERNGRTTRIHCRKETIDISEKLSELEKKLNPVIFVRCHNSFIVNFMAVREFTRTDFVLNEESIIPISRYKLNETRERFFVWSKQYI